MTWADDDQLEVEARRQATRLHDQKPATRIEPEPGPKHDLSNVEIGWEIYSLNRTVINMDEPVGGIVTNITSSTWVDYQTGEMVDTVHYQTLDAWRLARNPHLAWHILTDREVDPASIQPPRQQALWVAIRRLCRMVAESRGRQGGPDDLDHIATISRLARACT